MSDYGDEPKRLKLDPHLSNAGSFNVSDFTDTEELEKEVQQTFQEKEDYKENVLDTLKKIEKNTADIGFLVSLVQQSNENEKEVLNVVQSIMEITTAKSVEEAENKYNEIMKKVNQFTNDMNTFHGLLAYGKTVCETVKSYLGN